MTTIRSAIKVLEREFLQVRHRLLDVAATLDRIDRGTNAADAGDDPRMTQIRRALRILSERESGRAERVQMAFSRAYDPKWRS